MTYSKELLEKLAASNRKDIAEWERLEVLHRVVYVRVAKPLVDGTKRLRAAAIRIKWEIRREGWPTMSKVKSEYHRRHR